MAIASILSPTINYEVGHISSFPIIFSEKYSSDIRNLVTTEIGLSKSDWDAYETSWDFKRHPLV